MPKLVTEDSYPNRKIRYQAYVGGIVTAIVALVGIINSIHPFGFTLEGFNTDNLTELGLAITAGAAALMTIINFIAGYFTHPGVGDGVKPK